MSFGQTGATGSSSTTSGFSLLPTQIQSAFNQYAGTVNNTTANDANLQSAFTPQQLNQGSENAMGQLENSVFSPTASSISSDIDEQMNPYNSDVINQIELAGQGQQSELNSELSNAGQFGSNRAALGANNITQTQENTVGNFLNGEYNTALGNALTTIPQAQTTAAQNAVTAGLTQQQQAMAYSTAPYTSLAAYSSLLNGLPQSGGTISNANNVSSGMNAGI
jgi:hypothetical protein